MKQLFFISTLVISMIGVPLSGLYARFFVDPNLPMVQPGSHEGISQGQKIDPVSPQPSSPQRPSNSQRRRDAGNQGSRHSNSSGRQTSSGLTAIYKLGFGTSATWEDIDSGAEFWPELDNSTRTSLSVSLDLLGSAGTNFDIGFGGRAVIDRYKYSYSSPYSGITLEDTDVLVLFPIFLVGKIHFFENFSPFLSFEVGYNVYTGLARDPVYHQDVDQSSLAGGMHYAVSAGIMLGKAFQMEISWAHTEGGYSDSINNEVQFYHESVMISAGILF